MTDYRMKAESGRYEIRGEALTAKVTRGAESWQFFAFIFAALVTLAFAVVDELVVAGWFRLGMKAAAFLGLAEVTLINGRCRNFLVNVLIRFKEVESR
jgi:hypothetical protein